MKKELRLRRSSDFDRVFKGGRSWANRLLVLYARRNDLDHNRYGFAASKRVGKATHRNRAKRLMREAVRLEHDHLEPGWDMVLIARSRTPQSNCPEMRTALVELVRKGGLLQRVETGTSEKLQ